MARTKQGIIDDTLERFGFETGQSSKLDDLATKAFENAIRKYSNTAFQWSRVRNESFALTQSVATITLKSTVGKIDELAIRVKQGTNIPYLIKWMNPTDFDVEIADQTREGRPGVLTSVEHTETRKVQIFPVPDRTDYSLVLSYHRNLEFKADGTSLTSTDLIVAPVAFEELMIIAMMEKMGPKVWGASDERTLLMERSAKRTRADLLRLLPVVDPQIQVRPGASTLHFNQGI